MVHGGDKAQPGAVIYRTHNSRPWKSYQAVAADIAAALGELGFAEVALLPDDMRLPQALQDCGAHLVWLNTGGVQGLNPVSHTPALLELLGMPYVGHSSLHASLLDNKDALKRMLQALGIPTAPFVTWHPGHGPLNPDGPALQAALGGHSGPLVVKPVSGRASLHVYVVDDRAALADVAAAVYTTTRNSVLIEPFLPGREFCVSVCGPVGMRQGQLERRTAPFAFSALERVLAPDERIFTSMDQRPITASRASPVRDADLEMALLALAQRLYAACGLQSLVRVDVRADTDGALFILEANPKPDLKRPDGRVTSLTLLGLDQTGLGYTDLILNLLVDRLDTLLRYEPEAIAHIVELLPAGSA